MRCLIYSPYLTVWKNPLSPHLTFVDWGYWPCHTLAMCWATLMASLQLKWLDTYNANPGYYMKLHWTNFTEKKGQVLNDITFAYQQWKFTLKFNIINWIKYKVSNLYSRTQYNNQLLNKFLLLSYQKWEGTIYSYACSSENQTRCFCWENKF